MPARCVNADHGLLVEILQADRAGERKPLTIGLGAPIDEVARLSELVQRRAAPPSARAPPTPQAASSRGFFFRGQGRETSGSDMKRLRANYVSRCVPLTCDSTATMTK